MTEQAIRFDDAVAYEQYMGKWSRLAGDIFLDWLAPPQGLRWIDVGCGNGAFTELLIERCAPAKVNGIDPSSAQLDFARGRPGVGATEFQLGDAMALPFADDSFDAAIMALVIFFVPDPAKGVAEMARVTKPGGLIASYAWDILGGGFPLHLVQQELRALGFPPPWPPRADVSPIDAMRSLWADAGLQSVEAREIKVRRSFANFDDFWAITLTAPSIRATIADMAPADVEALRARTQARMSADADGRIHCDARANAVRGFVAG